MMLRKMICFALATAFLTALPPIVRAAETDVAPVLQPSPYTQKDFASKSVTLKAAYPVYAPDVSEIDVVLTNNTNNRLEYGAKYSVEVFQDGKWFVVPMKTYLVIDGTISNIVWPALINLLEKKAVNTQSVNMDRFDYSWENGKYRVVKEIGGALYNAEFSLRASNISASTPYGYKKLEDLPTEYSLEDARRDGVCVYYEDGTIANKEKASEFIKRVSQGIPCMFRYAVTGKEGGVYVDDITFGYANGRGRFTIRGRYPENIYKEGEPIITGIRPPFKIGYYETKYYSFMSVNVYQPLKTTNIVFSNYISLNKYIPDTGAWSGGYGSLSPFADISDAPGLVSAAEKHGNAMEAKLDVSMCAFSPDGKSDALLFSNDKLSFGYDAASGRAVEKARNADALHALLEIFWLDNDRFELLGVTKSGEVYDEVFNTRTKSFEDIQNPEGVLEGGWLDDGRFQLGGVTKARRSYEGVYNVKR